MEEPNEIRSAEAGEPPAASKSKRDFSGAILEYVELFTICLCVIMFIFALGNRLCRVSGDSMLPTLKNQQLLLVSDMFYEPEGGDIIVFHQTSHDDPRFNEPIVKRVIATEGQHVVIDFKNKQVSVDGTPLHEDYIQLIYDGNYRIYAEYNMTGGIFEATVPENCVFVMGDNRNNSTDSRASVIGFVDCRRILGKVILRLTPLEVAGPIN